MSYSTEYSAHGHAPARLIGRGRSHLRWLTVILGLLLLGTGLSAVDEQRAFYLNSTGSKATGVHQLSDGTWLVCGASPNLAWLPSGTTVVTWSGAAVDGIPSTGSGLTGWLIRLSADMTQVLNAQAMPAGKVTNLQRIRSTEVPGSTTGSLYISGQMANTSASVDGYFIAKLNNNFVSGTPTGLSWAVPQPCRSVDSQHEEIQPWDVRSDGKVVYVQGAEYGADWVEMGILNADGTPGTMEWWPAHWTASGEVHDVAASTVTGILRSAIVFKNGRAGQLRSKTAAQYAVWGVDANGKPRKGTYPDDLYFSQAEADGNGTGGYTGYRPVSATARVGQIAIDRRDNTLAFGYSFKSTLPNGGNPDFEPAVVVMNSIGQIVWWDRLYSDFTDTNGNGVYDSGEPRNSTPDQYVEAVAWDYGRDRLVVLARCHGNNTLNFYNGNAVAWRTGESGFQNQFTGTNGNIHLSWLGSFQKATGRLYAATYVGDYRGWEAYNQTAIAAGPCAGWANPNQGWVDLNTTRCDTELSVSSTGLIAIGGVSSRPVTSTNAWIPNAATSSTAAGGGAFLRVFEPDLSMVRYGTLLRDAWTVYNYGTSDTLGFVLSGSTLVVTGSTTGADLKRVTGKPSTWGALTAAGANDGFLARFDIDQGAAAPAAPVISSTLTASATVGVAFSYTIVATQTPTSFAATGLPAGLSINTSSGVISGTPSSVGTANIVISATNGGGTDTRTLVLTVSATGPTPPTPPTITSPTTASGTVGVAFTYQIQASGTVASYGATGLPAGLSINTSSGVISGTPSSVGTANIVISATNGGGTATGTLVLTVSAGIPTIPVITSATTASGTVGVAFTYQIQASGTVTSYGATGLPGGLTCNTSTGVITGTPTATGSTPVVISTSNGSVVGTATLTITIAAASIAPAPTPPPASNTPPPATSSGGGSGGCGIGAGFGLLLAGLGISLALRRRRSGRDVG